MAHSHLPHLSLEEAKKEAADQWNQLLKRIEVKRCRRAWPSLFRSLPLPTPPFPQTFYETDSTGNDWHLDVTHQEIKPGKAYTNIGFWDLFRTSFPLFSLVYPDYYRHFLEGFLNTYQDTGFLPKWLAPDERGMMPGTLIDGVFADAVTKGIAPDLHEKHAHSYAPDSSKKLILINILVAMAMKATRPLATYPMIFTKVWAIA